MKLTWQRLLTLILIISPIIAQAASDNIEKRRAEIKKELNTQANEKRLQQQLKNSNVVCNTKIIVTKSKTVSFYAGRVRANNYLGTASVGEWINNNQFCLKDQPVIAVIWDEKGKAHKYYSQDARKNITYNNVNKLVLIQYPKDFAKAPINDKPVICRVQLLNNSKQKLDFFGGKSTAVAKLGTLMPWQKIYRSTPCFNNGPILARITVKSDKGITFYRYKSKQVYSDINTIPTIVFPNHFVQQKTITIPLSKEILALLD